MYNKLRIIYRRSERMSNLRCRKCGNEIEEGMTVCDKCGTPVSSGRSVNYAPRRGGRKPRNITLTAFSALFIMFSAISFLLSGIAVKAEALGSTIKASIPVLSASSVVGLIADSGMLKFLFGAYIVFAVVIVLMLTVSMYFIIIRKKTGILAGVIGNALAALFGIIIIITSFVINSKYGGSAFAISPSVWLWLNVPINIASAVFILLKKDDIV